MIQVRALDADDGTWRAETLRRAWGSTEVARKGELVDAQSLDGLVALHRGQPAGLLTFAMHDRDFEVVTIHAEVEGIGVGRALMDAARERALELGARRMWLVTTNNNARAFRFYQRWGMDLAALRVDGIAEARQLKPSIPLVDDDGVPIRHELEFELVLTR